MNVILGATFPDPAGQILGTGFQRFERGPTGIEGLCKESDDGTRLDLLAVVATDKGKGQFRQFIHQCKAIYHSIYIWEDWNPILAPMLERYGFERTTQTEEWGEVLTGWKWPKSKTTHS